ncbi:DUF3515 domain-containing protein [Corynebacterium sp. 32222D000AT]|nr:DUF3515 domain-containing protein [Mycobacteriaceae bacterium]MDY5830152.1 DUF3515 domain-containing protein [Corynebacterium sp.]
MDSQGNQFNRTAVYALLAISLILIVAVLFGAKYYFSTVAREPVAMSPVPSQEASSAECAAVVDNLPGKFYGHERSEIVEPVPDGVAAWATISSEATTLRCGVDLPLQYTPYSETTEASGAQWLQVRDMTPGSTLTTWYTVDRAPVVAVTTHDDGEPEGLEEALGQLEHKDQKPHAAPLSQLQAADGETRTPCRALDAALPDTLAEDYRRLRELPEGTAAGTAVWTAPGREAVVLRCGVEPAPGYAAGEQVQQVNDVPWFEDTTLAPGTTASTWFALGQDTDIAAHLPQDVADSVLVELGDALAAAD